MKWKLIELIQMENLFCKSTIIPTKVVYFTTQKQSRRKLWIFCHFLRNTVEYVYYLHISSNSKDKTVQSEIQSAQRPRRWLIYGNDSSAVPTWKPLHNVTNKLRIRLMFIKFVEITTLRRMGLMEFFYSTNVGIRSPVVFFD